MQGEILWGCNVALALGGTGIALGRPLMAATACCVVGEPRTRARARAQMHGKRKR